MIEGAVVALTAIAMVIEQGIRPLIAPLMAAPSTGPFCDAVAKALLNHAIGAKPYVLRIGETPSTAIPGRVLPLLSYEIPNPD